MTTTTAPASSLLRLALRTDAVVSGLNGAGYVLLADPLSGVLGPSAEVLRWVGLFLAGYAIAVWLVGDRPAAPAVRVVIAGNLLWAAGSVAVVVADLGILTMIGAVWVVVQAAVVAGFALLQFAGSQRAAVSG